MAFHVTYKDQEKKKGQNLNITMRNPMSGTNVTVAKVKVSCKSKSINVGNRSAVTTC